MARAATTSDVFNALAEPKRRQLVDLLASGERSVTDLVRLLELTQPAVSKHLRVLRDVGIVHVRDDGRQRLYRLDPLSLRPIHDWVAPYQHLWNRRFEALDNVLDELQRQEERDDGSE
ncbi:ArsR/SmtB family transcription factor [Deinococcus yavapaiensis]|uniref:ArsR family transcriptional regulator n=1 Tax=Deinococcus yavapaiensis KR-236 TaxID=694435 RepID=A0A318SAY9_9DEIO|nr:metalloregulator ArsR/SmtB family transcription factor [Deinococcus yavapaiensis]PYE56590.1 ArsR family transcriptional regulator [Deinococcus yavapaiensis KR-236]